MFRRCEIRSSDDRSGRGLATLTVGACGAAAQSTRAAARYLSLSLALARSSLGLAMDQAESDSDSEAACCFATELPESVIAAGAALAARLEAAGAKAPAVSPYYQSACRRRVIIRSVRAALALSCARLAHTTRACREVRQRSGALLEFVLQEQYDPRIQGPALA